MIRHPSPALQVYTPEYLRSVTPAHANPATVGVAAGLTMVCSVHALQACPLCKVLRILYAILDASAARVCLAQPACQLDMQPF